MSPRFGLYRVLQSRGVQPGLAQCSRTSPCFGLRHGRMEHQFSKNARMGDRDEPPRAAGPGGPGAGAPGKGKGGGRGGKGRGGGDRSGDRSNPA